MRLTLSGIALINGLKLRSSGITCTAKRKSDGKIYCHIKKHSKRAKKIQTLALFILLILGLIPDSSNAPNTVLISLILPMTLFLIALRYTPNLPILNYHGAEHKVVVAYQKKYPITLESIKPISRVTNLCGTMLIIPIICSTMLLSIIVSYTDNLVIHIVATLLACLFLVHYFFVRGLDSTRVNSKILKSGKFNAFNLKSNKFYKLFDKAGYFLQEHFTTREPSDNELQVAILCMDTLLKSNFKPLQ